MLLHVPQLLSSILTFCPGDSAKLPTTPLSFFHQEAALLLSSLLHLHAQLLKEALLHPSLIQNFLGQLQ